MLEPLALPAAVRKHLALLARRPSSAAIGAIADVKTQAIRHIAQLLSMSKPYYLHTAIHDIAQRMEE